ncbi:hypothetical protein FRX31_023119 [Thalictrum thalictroides]|uniref:Uncharacterized protein n=1 Tax=Thalictrum thalictroides TaxID=46969 RepID=A0A7J6VSZ2_THATH|nr:hypothetical protein FRX31_023119 [Thalictrum thalictroides]
MCEFDAHLDCANRNRKVSSVHVHHIQMSRPQTLQHHNSFPIANQHQFQQFGSTSHPHDYYVNYLPTNTKQTVQPPKKKTGIGHAAMQGLVEGVAQQLGQNFAQNITGSNDGGIGADFLTSVLGNFF